MLIIFVLKKLKYMLLGHEQDKPQASTYSQ